MSALVINGQGRRAIGLAAAAVAFILALATAWLILVPAPEARAQEGSVTICHANPDDSYTSILVPAGDPQIAEHQAHPGDIIGGSCPAVDPIEPVDPNPGPPDCDEPCQPPDDPAPKPPEPGSLGSDGAGAVPTLTSAPSEGTGGGKALPNTGQGGLPIALVVGGLLLVAYGLRRAAQRLS